MFKRIKLLVRKIKHYFSYNACYDTMEYQGYAVFGMCCGVVGGDNNTEYLSYGCINCPYLTLDGKNDFKE